MKIILPCVLTLNVFLFCQPCAQADTKYWDLDGVTTGAGGAAPAGIWDTGVTANWTTDASGSSAVTTFANNDDAVFSAGTDATGTFIVQLSGMPVLGNLTVEEGDVTLSSGIGINIGGGTTGKGVIDVAPDSTVKISSTVLGGDNTGSITKGISGGMGTGTLILEGDNTYTGQTTLYAGAIHFNSIGNVGGASSALGTPVDAALGTLKMAGIGSPGGTLKYTGPGHSTDRIINLAGVTGTNMIDASGSGPLVFTSATGVTATGVGLHYLRLGGTNTGENKITGPIGENGTAAARITRLEKIGPGTWVLTGTSTFSGVCDIREGTLVINSIANKGVNSAIGNGNLNNAHATIGLGSGTTTGTLKYVGTAPAGHSSNRPITLWGTTGGGVIDASGVGPLVLSPALATLFASANPAGAAGKLLTLTGNNTGTNSITVAIPDGDTLTNKTSLTKTGFGKWVLTGGCTYTGPTVVNDGTLLINSPGSLAAGSAVTVAANATLGGDGAIQGPVGVSAGGHLVPGASAGTLTLSSNLVFAATADATFELSSSTGSGNDKIVMTGTAATLDGGGATLNIAPLTTLATADYVLFELIGASGSIVGDFATVPGWVGAPPANAAEYSVVTSGKQVLLHWSTGCATATVNAGPDQTVCVGNPAVTMAGSFTTATNAAWSGGAGAFNPNPSATNAIYTPTAGEIAAGTVTLTLTTDAGGTCGSVNDSMTITILGTTAIAAQPTNRTVCAASSATFTVGATGAGLGYQWQVSTDGGNSFSDVSPSATNSVFTLPAAMSSDQGNQYQVIVTGTCGPAQTSSPPAVLTVTLPSLNISQQTNHAFITWPADCASYVLEGKGDLNPLTAWTAVAEPVVPAGNENTVTTPLGATNRFFRLRHP